LASVVSLSLDEELELDEEPDELAEDALGTALVALTTEAYA
jgi:hypothetical protein